MDTEASEGQLTTPTPEAEQPSEPFKRIGCTVLTVFVFIILICSIIYFVTGLASIIYQFFQTFF